MSMKKDSKPKKVKFPVINQWIVTNNHSKETLNYFDTVNVYSDGSLNADTTYGAYDEVPTPEFTIENKNPNGNLEQVKQLISEFLSSEIAYLNDLILAFNAFFLAFKNTNVITCNENDVIFLNWLDLITSSEKVIHILKNEVNLCDPKYYMAIPTAINKIVRLMKPYIEYCKKSKLSMNKYNELLQKEGFRLYEEQCLSKHGIPPALKLGSFLLKPVQRLTKVRLLILQLHKEFPNKPKFSPSLFNACQGISAYCKQANDAAKSTEYNLLKDWLESKIYHRHDFNESLFNKVRGDCLKERKLLYHGVLTLVNKNKEVRCFLFDDVFIACNCPLEFINSEIPCLNCPDGCFIPYKYYLYLNRIMIHRSSGQSLGKKYLKLSTDNAKVHLAAKSEESANIWVKEIAIAVRQFLSKAFFKISTYP